VTTPFERYRALSRFPQMLAVAISDELISSDLRDRAATLLTEFPDEHRFCALVDSRCAGLPPGETQAVADAVRWLEDLAKHRTFSVELGQWLRWTLRHFPDRADVAWLRCEMAPPRNSFGPTINEWINPLG
jgi:hypothetical protein